MEKELIITVSKCTLVIRESELMACLAAKPEVFQRAIGRGKGYCRATSTKQRQANGFDQWQLYETLKGNKTIDNATFDWVQGMPATELRDGVCSFLERVRQCERQKTI